MNSEPYWKMMDRALYQAELVGHLTKDTNKGIEAGKKILDEYIPVVGGPLEMIEINGSMLALKAAAFLGKIKARA